MSQHQHPFSDEQLPTLPRPTITLHKETLESFRAEYQRLMEFMAFVVGKPVEKVAPIDVGAWAVRTYVEQGDVPPEMPAWIREEAAFVCALGRDSA